MTTKTETKVEGALEISTAVLELSEKLSTAITISENGDPTITENEWVKHAPNEVKKHAPAVNSYNALFGTALLHAFGNSVIEHIKAHPTTRSVRLEVPAAEGHKFAVNYTSPNGKKADGTPKDPSITLIQRFAELPDHAAVRQEIYKKTHALSD